MKIVKTIMVLGLIFFTAEIIGQELPDSYQGMLNEIITNFESIRGSNSITQGKTTLSVVNKDKIALRVEYKKKVKNLTFTQGSEEGDSETWVAANQLTIDMVNKHEDFLTKELETMLKYSDKRAKE